MYPFILSRLEDLIRRRSTETWEQKLRDLFIGIILNLCCNIENQGLLKKLVVEENIVKSLLQILVDVRQDWPTVGASQALLSICYNAMNESDYYWALDRN